MPSKRLWMVQLLSNYEGNGLHASSIRCRYDPTGRHFANHISTELSRKEIEGENGIMSWGTVKPTRNASGDILPGLPFRRPFVQLEELTPKLATHISDVYDKQYFRMHQSVYNAMDGEANQYSWGS
jgi:hypothetical protein